MTPNLATTSGLKNKIEINDITQNVARFIRHIQLDSGAIPWFENGKLDPWDHCEAIMALNIVGDSVSAEKAFTWLKENQNKDGSWFAKYFGFDAESKQKDDDHFKIETNFVAYPATALWHHFLCFKDADFLSSHFYMIQKAIDFVVSHQTEEGDIQWALYQTQATLERSAKRSPLEELPKDALVTACASVLRSLECAIAIAETLNEQTYVTRWQHAHKKLADALKNKPWRFDRTWASKERFSMDWFYPILSGVYSQAEAALRIEQNQDKFIVEGLGCKCVSDEPWVTVAESCELVMALIASGKTTQADTIFHQLLRWQDTDGGFWTGWVYKDKCIWPEEKTTWTAAAISLAADALYGLTPAQKLFTTPSGIYCDLLI